MSTSLTYNLRVCFAVNSNMLQIFRLSSNLNQEEILVLKIVKIVHSLKNHFINNKTTFLACESQVQSSCLSLHLWFLLFVQRQHLTTSFSSVTTPELLPIETQTTFILITWRFPNLYILGRYVDLHFLWNYEYR